MALIKKTIVLSDAKNIGYATVVRVGSETGVKVVGSGFTDRMQAAFRIGKNTFFFPLSGTVTEKNITAEVSSEDEVGCLIATNGQFVAKGGAAPSLSELNSYFAAPQPSANKPTETAAPSPETEPEDKELLERLTKERENYYYSVKDKVDELFVVHPTEPLLSTLIPDSEWVRVRYEGEDYYVVGRLYEDKKVTFLGYGVPGIKTVRPPKVADGIATFLADAEGSEKGYWLFFQNADNGKIE